MEKTIYFDHSATTNVSDEVLNAMLPYFSEKFGNPSSIYSLGRESKKAIEEAREKTAAALGTSVREIYFTGSGTESDNWAIRGTAYAKSEKGKHIVTSVFEHHAVLHACNQLEREGFKITYVPVDEYGIINPADIESAITDKTTLVTIMTANNEIGTIQPISEIGAICKKKGVIFHTDAVQAVGNIPVDVDAMNVDLLTLSAHKFYGPKGVGALYIRKSTPIIPFIFGGAQERNRRAGTENVPGIVGLGCAIETAVKNVAVDTARILKLRDRTINEVMQKIGHVRLNGHREKRLPGNCNFSFQYIEGESLLLMLDMKGIAASSGSACTSGSLDPSHVLLAIGLIHEIAHGSLRITFGRENTDADVDYLMEVLPGIVSRLRDMSPLFDAKRGD